MPCYTAWFEHYQSGTPEYEKAKAQITAQLVAIKRIVDYYYHASNFEKPALGPNVEINPLRQPKTKKELDIRVAICHHFCCDGIGFTKLYDVCSLMNFQDQADKSYGAILLPCATLMRHYTQVFKTWR